MIVQFLPHSKRTVSSRVPLVRKIVIALYCDNYTYETYKHTSCAERRVL
jgi:hypothetical protein